MLGITKSFIPRTAVQRTIRRGIEMYEAFNGPASPEVKKRIADEVVRQANIMSTRRASEKEKQREIGNPTVLYGGRKVHTALDDE